MHHFFEMMQKPANVELGAKRKHVNVDVFLFPRDGLEMEIRKDYGTEFIALQFANICKEG